MSNYGRNFEFRISPTPEQRRGRYINGATPIPIGAPIEIVPGQPANAEGRNEVQLATLATPPVSGVTGIAVFEHAYGALIGSDPDQVTPSDFGNVPALAPLQLVSGTEVKVVLRNTDAADLQFLGQARGTPRVMVAPADLAGLDVGDGLRPGAGTDGAGYWALAGVGEDAWLIVTHVDVARGQVEAQLQF